MIGMTRALKRLNLRIAALLDNNTEWFGTRALQALAYFSTLTHLSLWTCALPFDLPQILAKSPLSNNLTMYAYLLLSNLFRFFIPTAINNYVRWFIFASSDHSNSISSLRSLQVYL